MAAITGIELKARLEQGLADWLCKKNDRLCLGKSVTSIDSAMKRLYNYWVITDQCALTDAEINCIVKDIRTYCNFTKPVRIDPFIAPSIAATPTVVSTESTILVGFITTISRICPTHVSVPPVPNNPTGWNNDGQWILHMNGSGGVAPYSYQWDCISLPVAPNNGVCGDAWSVPSGQTTDTLTLDDVLGRYSYKWRCTITDALGNTAQDEIIINNPSFNGDCTPI